jgi:hypothetical protein
MRRISFFIAVVCLATSPVAKAGWGEFWHRTSIDFHRNNCWPQPFQAQDRELTRSPLIAMTAAGWRQNNTLSDHFFIADDQSINQAGEIKIRWIVTQAPPHRRTVYVLRGATPESTAARVEAVQRKVEKYSLAGQQPDVVVTDIIPPGASGDYFDQVDRQFKQSIPAPRLPAMEATGGSN